jgi:hypothetical protein
VVVVISVKWWWSLWCCWLGGADSVSELEMVLIFRCLWLLLSCCDGGRVVVVVLVVLGLCW